MATLELWLKDNKLTKIADKLNENDVESLEDIQALDTQQDIEDLAKEMGMKTVLKKKFVKAVMKLNNITSAPVTQQSQNDDEKEMKQPEAPKPKRKVYNLKGVHAVEKLNHLDTGKRHRTIMVIGATGTGKTTLLNSMMNYLFQVEFDDPYRFKLIYEQLKAHGQAESVTDKVTAYHLDPPALEYQLTVIDTPGFGDTRGLSQDQKITKNIKKFFETEIQEIDAVCFVIRAPQARLTPTQKYIFAQILGIFGNDIANNILVLMTFADGKKPPALAALKAGNVPFGQSFKLNNSAFDLPEAGDEVDMFSEMFWKMGIQSFDNLFKAVDKLETKSLTLTRKVLTRREQLETYVTSVQPLINAGFTVLEKLRSQIVLIQKYGDLINANKDFEYDITVTKARQVSNGGGCTTTCISCRYTCHKNCGIPDDGRKDGCSAMSYGHCTVCPSRCHWSQHRNLPYTIQHYKTTEKRTTQALKDKYYDSSNKKSAQEQIMAGTVTELAEQEVKLNALISGVRDCLNELSSIALRPNVLSQDDYIDKLIQAEEAEKKAGWQKRCGALRALKEKHDMLSKMNSDEYNPWAQYQDVQQFIKSNTTVSAKIKANKPKRKKGNKRHSKKSSGWFSGWI